MAIKLFLNQRSMNEVYTGGLGSYALVCMVVSFLQVMRIPMCGLFPDLSHNRCTPRFVQERSVRCRISACCSSNSLNYMAIITITRRQGYRFVMEAHILIRWQGIGMILEIQHYYLSKIPSISVGCDEVWCFFELKPTSTANDVSKNSFNMPRVRKTLAGAHEILTATAFMRCRVLMSNPHFRGGHRNSQYSQEESILSCILSVTPEVGFIYFRVIRIYEYKSIFRF